MYVCMYVCMHVYRMMKKCKKIAEYKINSKNVFYSKIKSNLF
jgi:hypothetical protein